jgi:hypothetical protein
MLFSMAPRKRTPFEFVGVMQAEAIDLQSALKRARILHSDQDIDAGGHHFEDVAREILQRRLPRRYDLGKGHIVDHGWSSSPEFDIVIADTAAGSIFFTASDGTRYYPYEGVYAIGEVKSSFRRSEKQQKLVASIKVVKSLRRDPTPNNYVPGIGPIPQVTAGWPFRNPLMAFAIFGEGRDIRLEDIAKAFADVPWAYVPNVLCFLDWGIVALCEIGNNDSGVATLGPMVTVPEFVDGASDTKFAWVRLPMGRPEYREAANLATLHFAIVSHVEDVALMPNKYQALSSYLANAGLNVVKEWQAVAAERPPGDKRPDTIRG